MAAQSTVDLLRRAMAADTAGDKHSAYALYTAGITAVTSTLSHQPNAPLSLAKSISQFITRARQLKVILDAETSKQGRQLDIDQAYLLVNDAESKALQGLNEEASLLYRRACELVLSGGEGVDDKTEPLIPDATISAWLTRGKALATKAREQLTVPAAPSPQQRRQEQKVEARRAAHTVQHFNIQQQQKQPQQKQEQQRGQHQERQQQHEQEDEDEQQQPQQPTTQQQPAPLDDHTEEHNISDLLARVAEDMSVARAVERELSPRRHSLPDMSDQMLQQALAELEALPSLDVTTHIEDTHSE